MGQGARLTMKYYFLGNVISGPLPQTAFQQYTNSVWETVKAAALHFGPPDKRAIKDFGAGRVSESRDDVLYGAVTVDPGFTGKYPDWMVINRQSNFERVHPRCYLFFQSTPDYTFPEVQFKLMPYYDDQLLNARLIFATLGTYWYNKWQERSDNSVTAQVKHKVVRVNVGLEAQHFAFKEPAKRSRSCIHHVSNLQWYKNPELMLASVKGLDTTLYVHSRSGRAAKGAVLTDEDGAPMANVECMGNYQNADPAFNKWLGDTCDFWISTSRLDAQSTAVLEMGARGLVPMVTPEVGFASPYAIALTGDAAKNRDIIANALAMSAEEYRERSHGIRQQVLKYHDWKTIYRRINESIALDISGQRVGPDPGDPLS